MPVEIFEPIVGYAAEIEMLSDSICAGKGWDQCDHHHPVNLGRLLIPQPEVSYIGRVTGDSMIGVGIYDDDLLMINRSIEPSDGAIVAVNLNGENLVKRLRLPDGGGVMLESANALFEDIYINEYATFIVIGVVTSVTRMFV